MKIFFNFVVTTTAIFIFSFAALSRVQSAGINNEPKVKDRLVNPLYELRLSNFSVSGTSATDPNELFFDIYVLHTNLPDSGPFEFSAGQYYLNFNPEIANGGTLTYSIVPNSTEFTDTNAVPVNPEVSGSQLRLNRNVDLGGSGPIISPIYPGTRVARMRIETTAPSFALQFLNFVWRDSSLGNPYTKAFAYIDGISTEITDDGTLKIDTNNIFLPVELSGFAALLSGNNVKLNWSTTTETNNSGFDIERSVNNGQWTRIGNSPGNGTSSSQNNYSFEDRNLNSGDYNYRLKQIDYNGNFEYFNLTNEVVIGTPGEFSLQQNYPNPFNPSTKINFDIPQDVFVKLRIFDVSGKELKTLVNEFKVSGYYSVDLDASALPSGTYFYRLEAGNFSSTKKLILLK